MVVGTILRVTAIKIYQLLISLCCSPYAHEKYLKVLLLLFGLLATEWYQIRFERSDNQSLCNYSDIIRPG